MRNEDKELVREEMKKSGRFSKDVCNMSISDIVATINYSKERIYNSGTTINYAPLDSYRKLLIELESYMFEFTLRLSSRSSSFKENPEFKIIETEKGSIFFQHKTLK